MEQLHGYKGALSALVGALTGFWGWLGWLVVGWVAGMVLDYLTGSLAAAKAGCWSSARAREGIWHKAGMMVVVLVSAGADLLIAGALSRLPVEGLPVEYAGLICPVVLCWYIVTELGSMAEHAAALGAPVPGWLRKLLAVSQNALDGLGEQLGREEPKEGEHDG